jgi:hypothetical protein
MTAPERDIVKQHDDADIRAELDRVVVSLGFSKSPQLASFLRFVVEEVLAGNGNRIKAYSIATAALGREANFEPQNDSIVRVEAGRLRLTLEHYYANGGHDDPIVIELPRGHYIPIFRANTAQRRAIARIIGLPRQLAETLRENFRLVVVIVVIAGIVSVAFDLLWMVLGATNWSAILNTMQFSPQEIVASDMPSDVTR